MEIERLSVDYYMIQQEKTILQERRDAAFKAMLEVLVDRRQLLSVVQDFSGMFGRSYKVQAQKSEIRAGGQELVE